MTSASTKIARLSRCRACIDSFISHCRNEGSELELVFTCDGNPPDGKASAFAQLFSAVPDLIAIDVDFPGGAFDLAGTIRQNLDDAKLVFMGHEASDLCIQQALAFEACGYLLKSEPAPALLEHVTRIARGEVRFSPQIAERLVQDRQTGRYRLRNESPFGSFSALQLEILRHLARGDSLKMVARKMNLSRKSVDGHKYRIMRKIGVNDRVLLCRLAIREGLIEA